MSEIVSPGEAIVKERFSVHIDNISIEDRVAILADLKSPDRVTITESINKIVFKHPNNFIFAATHTQLSDSGAITLRGKNNFIYLAAGARIPACRMTIDGNDNFIIIGQKSRPKGHLSIQGNQSHINIAKDVFFTAGLTHFSVQEDGVNITVGEGSLIGATRIRTSDSHSILDMASGERINPAASVTIGRRVWTAQDVRILKGVQIADDTIIGAGSIVTKSFSEPNTVLAGSPAKVVRRGVIWDSSRIGMPAGSKDSAELE